MKFFYIKNFLKLIRINNLLIIFITQLTIKAFIIDRLTEGGSFVADPLFFLLNLSTILIAAAGYIINDYYDIKIDLLNKPGKLVIGKFISRRLALIWHLTLTVAGVVLGIYNGYLIGLLHALSAFVLWLYSNKLKRLALIGNISVAILSGLSVFLVAILYRREYDIILSYSIFAFYISLIREIIKDMEDIKGDAAFGCKTLPILWGFRKTKRAVTFLMALFIITLLALTVQFSLVLIIYLMFTVVSPMGYLWVKLNRADTLKDFKKLSFYCKMIMVAGLGSILLLN